jgi:hypothetical protein
MIVKTVTSCTWVIYTRVSEEGNFSIIRGEDTLRFSNFGKPVPC